MRRFASRWLTLCGLVGVSACSLLVDTSELDAGCGPGTKECEGKCVGIDEPFYGCSQTDCVPCPGDHIVHSCENGECTFVECQHGWGCTGCTTNLLTTADSCGACDRSCPADWTCSAGYCVSPEGDRDPPGTGGEGGGVP